MRRCMKAVADHDLQFVDWDGGTNLRLEGLLMGGTHMSWSILRNGNVACLCPLFMSIVMNL